MLTVKEYDKIIRSRMKTARYKHSRNVAKEAVRLAKKYGADPDRAEIAGILHDITKETPPDEQLQIMKNSGIVLNDIEKGSQKLWHAISGSAYIKTELGITDEDILNAVRYHTTARAGMSILEKVLFIADFTSEERDYDGVENMRKAADKSLEDAMIEGLSFSIADLAERKLTIAEDTFFAYNEVVFQKSRK
ncbi:MAG: bis(5'-nucleosyl)-tetraphosphatase (symmetrical) YqeK [Acutalibacteraceae bacterium]